MFVTVTLRHLAALAARVLKATGIKYGDQLELQEDSSGFLPQHRRLGHARLAPLRGKLRRGRGSFELARVREQAHESSLRV